MEKKFLSEMGLSRLISHIKAAISGKADVSALLGKQDKLTGQAGQIVGFDANGNAVAQTGGADGRDGAAGKDGADGKSAYESAKDGGYSGTETQFNADLAQVSEKQAQVTYSTVDLEDGTSALATGALYVVYE